MMLSSKVRYCLASTMWLFSPLLANAQGHAAVYLSFQVPDSIATYPLAVNAGNIITGYYISPSGATHGFVREPGGKITKFDVPGSSLTQPVSINNAGEITGSFVTEVNSHPYPQGFVRDVHGKITAFGTTVDDQGFVFNFFAQPVGINRTGEIVGNFPFPEAEPTVFIRSESGAVSYYRCYCGADYPTVATGMNDSGAVIGYATDEALEVAQGFLQDPMSGQLLDGTGISVEGSLGTYPTHINDRDDVVGCYSIGTDVWDPSPAFHDFLWQRDGTVTTFTVPGTVPSCVGDFYPGSVYRLPPQVIINDRGLIVGSFLNQQGLPTGFIRTDHGQLTTFSHPEGDMTMPTAVNDDDVIVGYFAKGMEIKGFIRLPEDSL